MGASADSYLRAASNAGGRQRIADEVWAINSMGGVIEHELLFHMDDCRIQEARAAADPNGNIAGMLDWLKRHPNFMTSKAYPEYRGAVEFPLQAVLRKLRQPYFNNTVAYAMAYAIFIGVKRVAIYGADYSYPHAHKAESGRGCLEFWIGLAAGHGVEIVLPSETTLMDCNVPEDRRWYGYDADHITLKDSAKGVLVKREPRSRLPTAEEIEQRYNHEPLRP